MTPPVSDGSLSHDTFMLTQRRVFTLLSYRSIQRGPSFPRDLDAHVDRESRRYTVHSDDRKGGEPKVDGARSICRKTSRARGAAMARRRPQGAHLRHTPTLIGTVV